MLTHMVILLDDTSVSYCYYANNSKKHRLISLEDLKSGIRWAMKENLHIQFVYPDYSLPNDYLEAIETIDHTNIKPESQADGADVIVLTNWKSSAPKVLDGAIYVLRANSCELQNHIDYIRSLMAKASKIAIVLTDTEAFSDKDIPTYQTILEELSKHLCDAYQSGNAVQVNLLTDRIMLNEMNNCDAGINNITLAPNGGFYLCPAFYYDNPEENNIGNLRHGLTIKNRQLLRLNHAPICRNCDAYHCRRCVWLNCKLTLDYNTPSHQQCVIAHIERNVSQQLQKRLQESNIQLSPNFEIKEIDYLDPFNKYSKWK